MVMILGPTQRAKRAYVLSRPHQAGDVHPNPGPTLECLQLNINGASPTSLVGFSLLLEKLIAQQPTPVDLVILQETRLPSGRVLSCSVPLGAPPLPRPSLLPLTNEFFTRLGKHAGMTLNVFVMNWLLQP